ncbi:hypothetical protein SAMN04487866_102318 [Thermoactinomyces sp. DSM 45891]|nr:hypothetical protein SAMN04487866_102318 [Thermoactinomyces sp. DSM 45891]
MYMVGRRFGRFKSYIYKRKYLCSYSFQGEGHRLGVVDIGESLLFII